MQDVYLLYYLSSSSTSFQFDFDVSRLILIISQSGIRCALLFHSIEGINIYVWRAAGAPAEAWILYSYWSYSGSGIRRGPHLSRPFQMHTHTHYYIWSIGGWNIDYQHMGSVSAFNKSNLNISCSLWFEPNNGNASGVTPTNALKPSSPRSPSFT